MTFPKITLTQILAAITIIGVVGGWVVHVENGHVQEAQDKQRGDIERDSIINAMRAQNVQIGELRAALQGKIVSDASDKQVNDTRIDAIEKNQAVYDTKFSDYLLYNKK